MYSAHEKIQLFVSSASGRTILAEVLCGSSVAELATTVGKVTDAYPCRFSYNGKILRPETSLSESGVVNGSTILSFYCLHGGRIDAVIPDLDTGLETVRRNVEAETLPAIRSEGLNVYFGDTMFDELDMDIFENGQENGAVAPAFIESPEDLVFGEESMEVESDKILARNVYQQLEDDSETTATPPSVPPSPAGPEIPSVVKTLSPQSEEADRIVKISTLVHRPPSPLAKTIRKGQRGLAYDISKVEDEKTRKRLLKNRRTAERSRARKRERLEELEAEVLELRALLTASNGENSRLAKENADLRLRIGHLQN